MDVDEFIETNSKLISRSILKLQDSTNILSDVINNYPFAIETFNFALSRNGILRNAALLHGFIHAMEFEDFMQAPIDDALVILVIDNSDIIISGISRLCMTNKDHNEISSYITLPSQKHTRNISSPNANSAYALEAALFAIGNFHEYITMFYKRYLTYMKSTKCEALYLEPRVFYNHMQSICDYCVKHLPEEFTFKLSFNEARVMSSNMLLRPSSEIYNVDHLSSDVTYCSKAKATCDWRESFYNSLYSLMTPIELYHKLFEEFDPKQLCSRIDEKPTDQDNNYLDELVRIASTKHSSWMSILDRFLQSVPTVNASLSLESKFDLYWKDFKSAIV